MMAGSIVFLVPLFASAFGYPLLFFDSGENLPETKQQITFQSPSDLQEQTHFGRTNTNSFDDYNDEPVHFTLDIQDEKNNRRDYTGSGIKFGYYPTPPKKYNRFPLTRKTQKSWPGIDPWKTLGIEGNAPDLRDKELSFRVELPASSTPLPSSPNPIIDQKDKEELKDDDELIEDFFSQGVDENSIFEKGVTEQTITAAIQLRECGPNQFIKHRKCRTKARVE